MWGDIAIAFVLSFITAFMITPYTIKLARKVGALDVPKESRRIHEKPMPRLGGIAVVSGFFVAAIYLISIMTIEKNIILFGEDGTITSLLGFLAGAIILITFCLIDDIKQIPAIVKLFGQILASTCIVFTGTRIVDVNIPFIATSQLNSIVSIIITYGWIIGITNAINLIDGLDGLATGISAISAISLLIIFSLNGSPIIAIILIAALTGALIGFLPYNFNPAKTFIGDTGSNFLGFSLAIISILGIAKTYTAIVIVAPLIVLALPIFDTLFAIVRRVIKGKSLKAIIMADKGHLHHRIMKKGYTQRQAVILLYCISAISGMFAVVLLESGIWKALSFALIVIAVCAIGFKQVINLNEED